ncbi:ThrRS/AlaRS common domain-containing protein [Dacryopinax primogenitus]|uniref:ThrRS/AlaRS common domain-containing protein n=1 Tax=Dacryopinax primogenitus (strain DJM 731) TaxID=1858805 RepID=M5G798_DACPD|nr:ThrRS/AlaRS common domain-containing protein [Dacryopinax primogenitus]EJT99642.1 ThrRS/AlaRS common domain-containing protein [Dacryopinax primogenitus]
MAVASPILPPLPAHLIAPSIPNDYLRPFSFPLPKHKFVGVLACQRDPLLKELDTKVTRCEKRSAPAPATGKGSGKGQKGKKDEPVVELWEVELEDTVLFPEGGGQPSDTGTIVDLTSGTSVKVEKILRHGLTAVHYCLSPLPVGTSVRIHVDWDRRWDHMTQHTGQHVLSGLFDTLSLPTLSWSLTPSPQACYIELPRTPTATELAHVQESANQLIRANTRVHVSLSLSDSASRPKSMPEDYVGGVVREVDIVGVDRGPCCGTHLPSLAPLQMVYVFPWTTSVRGTSARVYFAVGPRVLAALAPAAEGLRQVGLELGCAQTEAVDKVREVIGQGKDARKREQRAREELAGYVTREVLDAAETVDGVLVGTLFRQEEDSPASLEFLSNVSYRIKDLLEARGTTSYLFALASSGPGGSPLVIFGMPETGVVRAGELVREKLGGVKGGGRGRWQGKKAEGKWTEEEEKVVGEIVRQAAGL